ncbi:MAG: CarD family transcriptional regulator [Acidobacteriota bacterium]
MNSILKLTFDQGAVLILTVGKKVVYPCQGPCLIEAVVRRIGDDRPMMFYQLRILNEGGGELFVPVDKVLAVGIRPLLEKSEIPHLLDHLKKPAKYSDNYRERARDNLERFTSGSAFALAEVIKLLTDLSETKSLSFGEIKTLEKARSLLICEIAEVMGETKEEAGERIDKTLTKRVEEILPSQRIAAQGA